MTVLKRAYDQALPKAKLKNIELILSEGTDAKANIDLKWTTEAVFNIIDNAIKYSEEGTEICISVFSYELFSGIRVSDQGIGITEDEIPKVFSRFYRGSAVHDKEGIGVGLYLSRQIVEDHGGGGRVHGAGALEHAGPTGGALGAPEAEDPSCP